MIRNLTRQTVVARTAWEARSFCWRGRGMIARRFDGFDALIFPGASSIHMCFMGQALDVIFLDRDQRVRKLVPGLKPWRLAGQWGAVTVIELPVGAIAAAGTAVGDQLALEPVRQV